MYFGDDRKLFFEGGVKMRVQHQVSGVKLFPPSTNLAADLIQIKRIKKSTCPRNCVWELERVNDGDVWSLITVDNVFVADRVWTFDGRDFFSHMQAALSRTTAPHSLKH